MQTGLPPASLPGGTLPIHQQAQACFARPRRNRGHLHRREQGMLQAHQLQGVEFVERRRRQHGLLLVMSSNTRGRGYWHGGEPWGAVEWQAGEGGPGRV